MSLAAAPELRTHARGDAWRRHLALDRIVVAVALACLAVLIVFPLAMLLMQAVFPAGAVPLGPFVETFSTPSNYIAIIDSIGIGLVVCVTASLIGIPLAILLNRTDLPGRRIFEALVWVDFFTPSYLVSLGWTALMQRGGFLDLTLGHMNPFASSFFSPFGIALVLTFKLFPFVYLAASAGLQAIGAEYEEAARVAGSGRLHAWLRIVIPLLRPAILAGLILVFAEVISDFGIAATIGQQAGFPLMTLEVYNYVSSWPINYPLAAAMSTFLVLSMGAALGVQSLLLRRRSYQVISGRAHQPNQIALGAWKWAVLGATILVFAIALGAPFTASIAISLMQNIGRGLEASNFGFQNYASVLSDLHLGIGALWRSVELSIGAATLTSVLSLLVTYMIYRWRGLGRLVLNNVTVISMVVPSIVMAAGYVFAFNQAWLFNAGIALYGTLLLLLLSYIGQQVSMAVRLHLSGVQQISGSLIDAAQVSGARMLTLLVRIVLPLMRKSIVSVWLLTFVIIMFDLAMSEMLYPPGEPTLGVALIQKFGDLGNIGTGTAMMMLAIGFVLAVVLIINIVFRGDARANQLAGAQRRI
ncbi:MAG TPA: iron ABC transporter permease [Candidatus Limnocylindrales bacterium]|nr:iron ABC transporter permease [Candidatus Limnocylindrales bacterium]